MSGPQLRVERERAKVERSEIAALMGVGRQRIVDLEGSAAVTPAATERYLAAVETVLVNRVTQAVEAIQAMEDSGARFASSPLGSALAKVALAIAQREASGG